jgi:methylase of polypeptide subunit release factors
VDTFAKDGARLHLVSRPRKKGSVTAALWQEAEIGPTRMLEPRLEPLLVFLASNAVEHESEPSHRREDIDACWQAPSLDREAVWKIAQRARALTELQLVISDRDLVGLRVKTSVRERLVRARRSISWDHVLPDGIRARLAEARTLRREGFGFRPAPGEAREVVVANSRLSVLPGVFPPWGPAVEALASTCASLTREVSHPLVVEVGTGSGAVAVTYAELEPEATVIATDISFRAVACARRNTRKLGHHGIRVIRGNYLDPLDTSIAGRVDVIVANMPYLLPGDTGQQMGVPAATVAGYGAHGIGHTERLAMQASAALSADGAFVVQCMDWQWAFLESALRGFGFHSLSCKPVDGSPESVSGSIVVGIARR